VLIPVIFLLQACRTTRLKRSSAEAGTTETSATSKKINKINNAVAPVIINTKNVVSDSVVDFAKTLIGIRYKYGSAIKD
jgi:hypothetical protein